MKTYIICEANYQGNTEFRCGNCGKHMSWIRIAVQKKCPRCEKLFKNKIKVVNYDDTQRKI